ncbi:energy-coupling factor transporter transmembrane component T family protein [Halalkalibacter akibai]|uniref:Energy-coupling factor transporter transmembrane protein EcfT n=1 Tax=Halalkalibacter akibai (strain ATCC 43226 / DSM 21942 / CIP 109018 / JCM 9157 / 1139) TaxID=1236973 RepID=W4QUS3_HALA3|nr:energy-coupling factor transporter transmembrane component T [Halalkalibacter akibai]GAE35363.1 transmembrane component of general energizing module of ECF transporters [Halalkalibacter akibai JCM 9157]
MLQNVIIGQYVSASSLLHRLDPRSKLISVFILVFIIFLANNWLANGIIILFTLTMVLLSRVPLLFIYKGTKPILWLVLFTFILHLFMTREGNIIYSLGFITIYEEGVKQGIFIAIRFITIIMLTSLVTLTTKPIDLTDGLEMILNPLKKVGLPAHELALMMSIALRFIPTLMQETEKIMKAQMARGVDFTTGPWGKRIKALLPLLIPLFISAFKRAEDLALAMEARGYRGGEGRSKFRLLQWQRQDTVAVIAV